MAKVGAGGGKSTRTGAGKLTIRTAAGKTTKTGSGGGKQTIKGKTQ